MTLNPDLEVAIWDGCAGSAQQIRYVYKDTKYPAFPDEIVYIEEGQLM